MRRPSTDEVERLEAELNELRAKDAPDLANGQRIPKLFGDIERLKRRSAPIPFIDPIDVRYNRFTPRTVPRAKAVMFCLMDVSASMGEREKDLAKRFFILLHLFLKRKYERVDIVFIRHTHEAAEVDEQEFFYGQGTGGTVVSSALKAMIEVREKRYPAADWNIYCAQASDGDNSGSDSRGCVALLTEDDPAADAILRLYRDRRSTARAEIGAARAGKDLWRGYAEVKETAANFAMARVAGPRATFIPSSANCSPDRSDKGAASMTGATLDAREREARTSKLLFEGAEWSFRDLADASTRRCEDRAARISASTSSPIRSRSFQLNRCSTPIPRSACR